MNIDMNTTQIIVALFIVCVCGILIIFKTSNETFPHEGPCFKCNETELCKVCPVFNPVQCAVNHAYITVKKEGRVIASSTLTFNEDFVQTQHPITNGIPSLIGMYKTEVIKWSVLDSLNYDVDIKFV